MTNGHQDLLGRAIQHHQSGRIQEALDLYRQILSGQQNNASLLCLLGIATLQVGEMEQGVKLIQRALSLDPDNVVARNNIGLALQAFKRLDETHANTYFHWGIALQDLKRPDEALASYDKALAIRPDFVAAWHNRGNTLQELKRLDEAITSYDKALSIDPGYAAAHHNRGAALHELKRLDEAIASYDKALAAEPNYAAAYHSRGIALHKLKRLDEALASYDKAVAINPDYADAHCSRGVALQELKRLDDALASYDKSLAIQPGFAGAHSNRGTVLRDLQRMEEAVASFDRALALQPGHAMAYKNRGSTLRELGRIDEALVCYDRALALVPDYADAYFSKSVLLLAVGKYLEGWRLYEWRFRQDDNKGAYYNFPQPAWRGDGDIRGKKLLIYAEQGYGDFIQFCRYLPQLAALGAELIVEVPKRLMTFISTLDCPMSVVEKGKPLPAFDAYCPIMSLPYALKTTLETIPARTPYLFSDAKKVRQWQDKLGKKKKARIGLAWSGAETHKNDVNRSAGLKDLLPLIALPSIEWHSLQKDYRQQDLEILKRHPEIRQHQDDFGDFSDTAALVECMDLVISVDTSVAHVVGAMGKPLWLLLSFAADFRWMLEGEDTPWYPGAKLYRQSKFGDWRDVVAVLQRDLINARWEKPGTPAGS